MRNLLPTLLFPFTLSAALFSAYFAQGNLGMNPEIIVTITLITCGLWIWLWEFLLPYDKNWNRNDQDLGTDVIHIMVQGVITKVAKPLYILILFPVITYLSEAFGNDKLWPHHWSLLAQEERSGQHWRTQPGLPQELSGAIDRPL